MNLSKKAEAKRQALVAEMCSQAIDALLDDTGPLSKLPMDIYESVRGEIESVVRTLTAKMDEAEELSEL